MIWKIQKKIEENPSKIQKKSKFNSEKDMEIMVETQVEYRKDFEKYRRKSS